MATTLTKFKGGKELQDFLNTLPAKVERNILRSALRQGANVIRKEAQSLAPIEDGDLRRSIKVKTRSKRGQVSATIQAGDDAAFYAHMVEFGTKPHWISVDSEVRPTKTNRRGKKKTIGIKTLNNMTQTGSLVIGDNFVGASVAHPGAKPHPFMRPAIDGKTNEAIVAVGNQIRKRLTKEGINAPVGLEADDE